MSILSGHKKYERYLKTNNGYQLCSMKTYADSVHFSDGTTVQNNLGAIKGITDSLTTASSNVALSAAAGNNLQTQVSELNSNLSKISYPYSSFTNQTLHGMVTKPQNDNTGNGNRYLIFIPTHTDTYIQYGVSKIKDIIIQGIAIIRQNDNDINGYQLINASQTYQAINLSVISSSNLDISGYLCDCNFDFNRV